MVNFIDTVIITVNSLLLWLLLVIIIVSYSCGSLRSMRSTKPGASDLDRHARAKSVTRGKSACLLYRARLIRVLAERWIVMVIVIVIVIVYMH